MEGASRNTFTVLSCTKVAIKNTDLRQDPLNTTKRTLALLLPKKANDNFKKCSFWSVENLITNSNFCVKNTILKLRKDPERGKNIWEKEHTHEREQEI